MTEKTLRFQGGRKGDVLDRPEATPCSAVYYFALCGRQALPAGLDALGEVVIDERDAFAHEFLSEIEKFKKHIVVLEGGVGERDAEIAQLRQSLEAVKVEARELQAALLVARDERDLRARRLEELLAEMEQHVRRVHEVETKLLEREAVVAVLFAREKDSGERFSELQTTTAVRIAALEGQAQEQRLGREREAARANALSRELGVVRERCGSTEERLHQALHELELRKQHITRLEGGVGERDEQIELLARELLEVKQSGALRVGRAISRLMPSALKQRVYAPLRKSESSAALQSLRGAGTVSLPSSAPAAAPVESVTASPSPAPAARRGLSFAFVVPVYNHARYLPAMIESLCTQTRPADEIILIDDNSPDAAVSEILARFQDRPRVKVLRNATNLGISATTNRGIEESTSSHVAFVDCDDIVESNALGLVEGFLRARPEVDFVYSNRVDIDVDGNELQRWDFKNRATAPPYEALMQGMFTSHLKVVSAAALRDVGGFKPRYDLTQDYDHALRLAERRTLGHLNAYVYRHRVHKHQQSQVNAARQDAMTVQIREDSKRRLALRQQDAGPLVSIVMLTYNRPEITQRAIESILTILRGRFELVIFDNASDPATLKMLATFEHDPRVRLVRGERNFGVSGGRRRAAREARGEFLFFIDSDIVVEDGDLLVKLVERLEEEPTAGACCCKVVFPNGAIQFNGGMIERGAGGRVRFALVDSGKKHDDLSAMHELECEWIPGGATMWRREHHERFEPSDEMLGAFEDNEMCLRVRKAGVKLLNCPTAVVIHHHHSFREESDQRYLKSRYDHERIITSMGVMLRDHDLLVDDDELYRMVGLDPRDHDAVVRRLNAAAAAGKTNGEA